MNEQELNKIKRLLGKITLLRWTKKYSADNLSTNFNGLTKQLSIGTDEDSVMIMDTSMVKALITDSKYTGEVHSSYDIGQLSEIISMIAKDKDTQGTLIVSNDKQKPLVIEYGKDTIILSPKVDSDRIMAEKKAKDEKSKEVKETPKKDKKGKVNEQETPTDEDFSDDDEGGDDDDF